MTGGLLASGPVPARIQMGASLGFHIILVCFGIALPAIVLIAHYIGIRRRDPAALLLARRWSKVMALLFAVGAVSGTVLSYEMGLLWPGLMGRYGSVVGIGFSIEAVFFFTEAVFLGVYLYGWRRLPAWPHWWTGMAILVSGLLGTVSVLAVNSWMNQPGGYILVDGRVTDVRPFDVYFNRATPYEVPHMVLAALMVAGFTVAGVYAVGLLRGRWDRYHRLGFQIGFWVGALATPVQLIVGDTVARAIAKQQPIKFAAMELVPDTKRGVTEWIGGIYIDGTVYFGIGVPKLDSILVGFSPDAEVIGWNSVAPQDRPPLANLIHWSFDIMVGIGCMLLVLAAWQGWVWWFRREILRTRWFLMPMAFSGAAAATALECGWIVTEVGRQPWIVYREMRVTEAVTTASGVNATLGTLLGVYVILTLVTIVVPVVMSRRWRREAPRLEEREVGPYAPPRDPEPMG